MMIALSREPNIIDVEALENQIAFDLLLIDARRRAPCKDFKVHQYIQLVASSSVNKS